MNSFDCFKVWLLFLIPSLIFGWGGVVMWTIIMLLVNKYYDVQYPNRNGSRARKESIEAEKNLSVKELNYIDKNPTLYKTYWYDKYVFKDVLDGHHKYMRFDFQYFRCPHCGHVMKVLIWKEHPITPLPITKHWCRGCQEVVDVVQIDRETYEYENKYYELMLQIMILTGIGNPDRLFEIFYGYWDRARNGAFCLDLCREFHKQYALKPMYHGGTHEPYAGAKYVYYNGSQVGENIYIYPKELQKNYFYSFRLEEIVIAFNKLRKYDFYKHIYVPAKVTVKEHLEIHEKEKYIQYIDEEGRYYPPNGITWENEEMIDIINLMKDK